MLSMWWMTSWLQLTGLNIIRTWTLWWLWPGISATSCRVRYLAVSANVCTVTWPEAVLVPVTGVEQLANMWPSDWHVWEWPGIM